MFVFFDDRFFILFSCVFLGGGRYVPNAIGGQTSAGGTDPFTGGGRYVPGQSSSQRNTANGMDPFTGMYPVDENLS